MSGPCRGSRKPAPCCCCRSSSSSPASRSTCADLDGTDVGELALILLVAIGGKLLGGFGAARALGVSRRHSAVLAVLLDTRGLTELIVLSVGVQTGVLDARLNRLMVVMAVATTTLTGVLLRLVYPPERVRLDAERARADHHRIRQEPTP